MLESEAYNFKDVFLNKAKAGKGNKNVLKWQQWRENLNGI